MWNAPVIGRGVARLEGPMTPFFLPGLPDASGIRPLGRPGAQLQQSRPVNLVSVLLRHVQLRPDAVAVVDDDGETTFAELAGLAAATAGSLAAAGIAPGDRVAIAAWNDLTFVRTYVGALWCGAVAVPMNPSNPAVALGSELERIGARSLVCGAGAEHLLGLPGALAADDAARGGADGGRGRTRRRGARGAALHLGHRRHAAAPRCSPTATWPPTSDRCSHIRDYGSRPRMSDSRRSRSSTSSA